VNVVILSARTGWQTDQLSRALAARGHLGHVMPYERLVARFGEDDALANDGFPILDADAVLARIIPSGSLEQIIYRVNALHWIERRGVTVMNPASVIERCVDKFYTTAILRTAGLPVPETVVCEGTGDAIDAVRQFGGAIIKPIFGSMGHGMVRVDAVRTDAVRVDNADVAFRVIKALDQVGAVFYVQRVVDHGGRDVRVFIVGGRVVAAIERRAPAGEWRTNVSQGGTAHALALPPEWEALALQAAAAVGADYAGVDLLPSRDGRMFVLEVNGIPGWQGLQEATGADVAGAIVDHLIARVRDRRRARDVGQRDGGAAAISRVSE
jgi:RimK family alpha-L-glutamate ligase